jgi:hypothetical protein
MAQLGELVPDSHDSHQLKFLETKNLHLLMYCVSLRINNVGQPREPELVGNIPLFHQFVELCWSRPTLTEPLSEITVFEIDISTCRKYG